MASMLLIQTGRTRPILGSPGEGLGWRMVPADIQVWQGRHVVRSGWTALLDGPIGDLVAHHHSELISWKRPAANASSEPS